MERKIYEPVGHFERATSYCPLYLAWRILDEARDYFRTPIPEAFATKLAHRAEAVFARHPFWQRKFQFQRGRNAILTAMRHWLAGVLAKKRPALFRDLPESLKVGHPLSSQPLSRPKPIRRTSSLSRPAIRFVHGSELLPAQTAIV
ncbi:MAG: hypothetical protein ABSH15_03155 [Verrucomicrobiota bacterium]|jgi:hypothetical protein